MLHANVVATAWSCESLVSIALQLIVLSITRFYLTNQIKRKDNNMKQNFRTRITIKKSLNSVLETLWSIGTSLTASAVLLS